VARACRTNVEPERGCADWHSVVYISAGRAYPSSDHLGGHIEGRHHILWTTTVPIGRLCRDYSAWHSQRRVVERNNGYDLKRTVRHCHKQRAAYVEETIVLQRGDPIYQHPSLFRINVISVEVGAPIERFGHRRNLVRGECLRD
jgi:hypothetical protein